MYMLILVVWLSSPVGALFVQHTVATLLATDGIATLESDLGIAVAAEVGDRPISVLDVCLAAALEPSIACALLLRRPGGHVGGSITFARHVCNR